MADKVIKAADLAKVHEVDFVESFSTNIRVLLEVLGITRKIEMKPGQVITTYKVTGELADGKVGEGEDIPLSQYKTETDKVFDLDIKKWRKKTTLEAIAKKGYDQAVSDTSKKMIRDVQSGIRKDFFDFIKTGKGKASGKGLQGALAQAWGKMQVIFEDMTADGYIYFVNPLDVADYLENAEITTQSAFGMTYIQGFLGTYDVVTYSDIPQGKVVATAKENIILYFMNPTNSDVGQVFDFTTDETGYIGVHNDVTYTNMTTDTTAICGMKLFAESLDYIVLSEIKPEPETNPEG